MKNDVSFIVVKASAATAGAAFCSLCLVTLNPKARLLAVVVLASVVIFIIAVYRIVKTRGLKALLPNRVNILLEMTGQDAVMSKGRPQFQNDDMSRILVLLSFPPKDNTEMDLILQGASPLLRNLMTQRLYTLLPEPVIELYEGRPSLKAAPEDSEEMEEEFVVWEEGSPGTGETSHHRKFRTETLVENSIAVKLVAQVSEENSSHPTPEAPSMVETLTRIGVKRITRSNMATSVMRLVKRNMLFGSMLATTFFLLMRNKQKYKQARGLGICAMLSGVFGMYSFALNISDNRLALKEAEVIRDSRSIIRDFIKKHFLF